jgi:rhodanese-related sulfurtransferase
MKAWWLPRKVPEIQPKELHTRLSHGEQLQIVDVRTRREFRTGHISGASNVPIQSLPREWPQLGLDPTRPVVTICKTAHRSIPATQLFRSHGFTAMQLAKGMDEWRRQGLPLESS